MNAPLVATTLGAAGAAVLVVQLVRTWLQMRRVAAASAVADGDDSVHEADPVALAALECVIVSLGIPAGWMWAAGLGVLGLVALLRYARRTRVVVTPAGIVFGSGTAAATLPFDELGSLVPAPRNGSLRSYGTLGFADPNGAWVGVVRPAALRHPAVMVATVVARSRVVRHDGEDGWRAPGAAPPSGRLPYFSR